MLLDFGGGETAAADGSVEKDAYAATSAAELAEGSGPPTPLGRFFLPALVSFFLLLLFPELDPEAPGLFFDVAVKRFFPSVESKKNRSVLRELSDARNGAEDETLMEDAR